MASPGRGSLPFSGDGGGPGSSSSAVKVAIRVRPFIKEDNQKGEDQKLVMCSDSMQTLEIWEPDFERRKQQFTFDRVYWSVNSDNSHYATQTTLFDELGQDLIHHALSGFNSCIFAYGQTGSGKSYSMLGDETPEGQGILPRVVQGLFEALRSREAAGWSVAVSFMEIYNEQIRDLLCERGGTANSNLKVQSHPTLGAMVPGLTDVSVQSDEQVMEHITKGMQQRSVASTFQNTSVTRSHVIFTLRTTIQSQIGSKLDCQMHIVDLAGSERASRTKARGSMLAEGGAINKSLTVLARVVQALADNSEHSGSHNKRRSTVRQAPPFRESKLTHILKQSLSGNSKTVMVAAISPNGADYEETLSTLRFAQSAKNVRLKVKPNEVKAGAAEVAERDMQATMSDEVSHIKSQLVAARLSVQDPRNDSVLKSPGDSAAQPPIPSGGSETNSPRESDASAPEEQPPAAPIFPKTYTLAYLGGGEPRISLGLVNSGLAAAPEETVSQLSSNITAAQALTSEGRSAFRLGRASLALAKLYVAATVNVEDPSKAGYCIVFEPKEGEGERELMCSEELTRRLFWLSSATDTDKSVAGPGLGLWYAAKRAVRKGRSEADEGERKARSDMAEEQRNRMKRTNTIQITELESQLATALSQLQATQTELKQAQTMAPMNQSNHSLQQAKEITELKKLLMQASQAGSQLVQSNQQLIADKEKLMTELEQVKEHVFELEDSNSVFETEIQELRRRIEVELAPRSEAGGESSDDEKQELFEEKEALEIELEELNKANKDLARRLTLYQQQPSLSKLQLFVDEHSQDEESSESESAASSELQEELTATKERLDNVERMLESLKCEYDEVVSENASMARQLEELEEKHMELIGTGDDEVSRLRQTCDELWTKNRDLEDELVHARGEGQNMRQKNAIAEAEITRIKTDADRHMQAGGLHLDGEGNLVRTRRSTEDSLQVALRTRPSGLDDDDDETSTVGRPSIRTRRSVAFSVDGNDIEFLSSRRSTARKSVRTLQSLERVRANAELGGVLASVEEKVQVERQKLAAAEREKSELQAKLNELQALQPKLKDAEDSLVWKNNQIKMLETEMKALKEEGSSQERVLKEELDKVRRVLNDRLETLIMDNLREVTSELFDPRDSEDESTALESTVNKLSQGVSKQAHLVTRTQAEVKSVSADLQTMKAKAAALEDELNCRPDHVKLVEEERQRGGVQIQALQAQIKELNSEIEELQEEIRQLHGDLTAARRQAASQGGSQEQELREALSRREREAREVALRYEEQVLKLQEELSAVRAQASSRSSSQESELREQLMRKEHESRQMFLRYEDAQRACEKSNQLQLEVMAQHKANHFMQQELEEQKSQLATQQEAFQCELRQELEQAHQDVESASKALSMMQKQEEALRSKYGSELASARRAQSPSSPSSQDLRQLRSELVMLQKVADEHTVASKENRAKWEHLESASVAREKHLHEEIKEQRKEYKAEMQSTRMELATMGLAADAALQHSQEEFKASVKKYQTELESHRVLFKEEMKAKDDLLIEHLSKKDQDLRQTLLQANNNRNTSLEASLRNAEARLEGLEQAVVSEKKALDFERKASHSVATKLQSRLNEEAAANQRYVLRQEAMVAQAKQEAAEVKTLQCRVEEMREALRELQAEDNEGRYSARRSSF